MEDSSDVIIDSDFTTPASSVTLDHVEIIMRAMCLYATLLPVKAEMDQLAESLELFGILQLVQEHSLSMTPLFVHDQDVDLTAEQVLELFSDIQYSNARSNCQKKQPACSGMSSSTT